jgi:hypothetical protein
VDRFEGDRLVSVRSFTLGCLPRFAWLVKHPELRGVFVGGCVSRGVGSKFRAKAHAHTTGEHRGWICFRSTRWINIRELWLHELAHVVTRDGHTDRWRAFLVQIGGTLDPVVIDGTIVTKSYHAIKRDKQLTNIDQALSLIAGEIK